MSKPSTIARGLLAVAAGGLALSAVAAPQVAAAQPYGYNGSYYDPCGRDQANRSVIGGLLGAGIGATVGSQMAARGHRTDGSVLGGVLGAGLGAVVGNKTAACNSAQNSGQYGYGYGEAPPPPPPRPRAYYEPAPPPPPAPADYDYDDGRWAYGHRGERFRIAERQVGPDGCTLAESPIYLPDGHVQKRFVRVCQDDRGRYQVVD